MVIKLLLIFMTTMSLSANAVELPLAQVEDHNFDIYVISFKAGPETEKAKAEILQSFPSKMVELAKKYVSSARLSDVSLDISKIKKGLVYTLKKAGRSMPEGEELELAFYFAPIHKKFELEKLVRRKTPLQTPVGPIYLNEVALDFTSAEVTDPFGNPDFSNVSEEAFFKYYQAPNAIHQSTERYNQKVFGNWGHRAGDDPAFLSNFSVQMRLKKGDSAVQVQALLGLKPMAQEKVQKSKEVIVEKIVIPQGKNSNIQSQGETIYYSSHATALISMLVKEENYREKPSVQIQFGAYGGVNSMDDLSFSQSIKNASMCPMRKKSVPVLAGKFSDRAMNSKLLSALLKGRSVEFKIFSMQFEFDENEGVKSKATDVRASFFGFLDCFSIDRVNHQIGQEVEKNLQEELDKLLNIDDMTDELLDFVDQH